MQQVDKWNPISVYLARVHEWHSAILCCLLASLFTPSGHAFARTVLFLNVIKWIMKVLTMSLNPSEITERFEEFDVMPKRLQNH